MIQCKAKYLTLLIILNFLFSAPVYAATFFDIPAGVEGTNYSSSNAPPLAEFSFLNTTTFKYTTASDTFWVEFRFLAPNNNGWETTHNTQQVNDYFTSGINAGVGSSAPSFNDVYAYFYRVQNKSGSSEKLTSFFVDYDDSKADIGTWGYVSTTGDVVPTVAHTSGQLQVFASLNNTQTTDWFFMTSKNWWGWSQTHGDGSASSGFVTLNDFTSSPSGQIPAPNPEAPTIALYLMGLFGMGWFARMKYFIKEKV